MLDILYDPVAMAAVAGIGWGALLYEMIQITGRLLLIKHSGIKLTDDQTVDLIDDGKINGSVSAEEDDE